MFRWVTIVIIVDWPLKTSQMSSEKCTRITSNGSHAQHNFFISKNSICLLFFRCLNQLKFLEYLTNRLIRTQVFSCRRIIVLSIGLVGVFVIVIGFGCQVITYSFLNVWLIAWFVNRLLLLSCHWPEYSECSSVFLSECQISKRTDFTSNHCYYSDRTILIISFGKSSIQQRFQFDWLIFVRASDCHSRTFNLTPLLIGTNISVEKLTSHAVVCCLLICDTGHTTACVNEFRWWKMRVAIDICNRIFIISFLAANLSVRVDCSMWLWFNQVRPMHSRFNVKRTWLKLQRSENERHSHDTFSVHTMSRTVKMQIDDFEFTWRMRNFSFYIFMWIIAGQY